MKTHTHGRRTPRFELEGGILCLDFVNTLDDRPSEAPKELLNSYLDLVRFCEDTGILKSFQADDLCERSQMAPKEALLALHSAIALREAMYAVFWAIVKKQPVSPAALDLLNGYVQEAAHHSRLVRDKRRFEWRFEDSSSLDAILWPIARSAASLLASEQLTLVRACSSKTCQWLFLDSSKNHRRRWCSMKLCGNRTKVRRFYARQKKQ